MENIKPVRYVDLSAFGGEGMIELRSPSARKQNEFKNAMSRYMTYSRGEPIMKDDMPLGDMEIAMAMSYIRSAPFPTTVNGFLDYCDTIDDNGGDSAALLEAIQKAMLEIDDDSPLPDSPSAETESSA